MNLKGLDLRRSEHVMLLVAAIEKKARQLNEDGAARTKLTSQLVNECIMATQVPEINQEFPALSKLQLDKRLETRIKIMKHLTHALVIQSPNLKTVEYRGYDLVKEDIRYVVKGRRTYAAS